MKSLSRIISITRPAYAACCAVAIVALLIIGLPGVSGAAAPLPLLNKVFVYEGGGKIRLVTVFSGPLDGSDPIPRLSNGTLSLFVRGARNGKPLRQFALGQGGYDRLEAREGKNGLWLTVRTIKGAAPLKRLPEITVGKSSLTVTLPTLKIIEKKGLIAAAQEPLANLSSSRAQFQKVVSSYPENSALNRTLAGKSKKPQSLITPDSILEGALSSPPANSVAGSPSSVLSSPPAAKKGEGEPLTFFRKKSRTSNLFSGSTGSFREKSQIGSNVVSFSSLALKFAGALGGILVLIIGGMVLFKKFAPSAVSRLGGNGSLVRTLYKAHLAPKKSLALVEVAGEVLVLGISGQNITMLTKIEKEETLARIRSTGDSTFVEHLSKMISNYSSGGKKEAEQNMPLLTSGKDSDDEISEDADQIALPKKKGAAALQAYARQVSPPAKDQISDTRPFDDFSDEIENDGFQTSSERSANRLRLRLNRVTSKASRSRATS